MNRLKKVSSNNESVEKVAFFVPYWKDFKDWGNACKTSREECPNSYCDPVLVSYLFSVSHSHGFPRFASRTVSNMLWFCQLSLLSPNYLI